MDVKRVLFIRSNPVNPDSRVEKEVNALIKNGYQVEVLAWDRDSNYKIRKERLKVFENETYIYRIGIKASFGGGIKKNIFPLYKFQRTIKSFIKKNKKNYDVIHACDFDTAYTAIKMAKKYKLKFVYDIFDYYVDSFNVPKILRNYIEKKDIKVINNSDTVIICSEQRLEQIKKSSPKNVVVIHNTPPKVEVNKILTTSKKIKISYVGILSEGRYLREISDFVIKNSNVELHVAGFGTLNDYFINLSTKHEDIHFYGKVEYEKGLSISKSSDIMMAIYNPNNRNNYYAAPNKFYESLMLGKPIIMAKNTGFSDVVKKNNFGLVIEYEEKIPQDRLFKCIKQFKQNKVSNNMIQLYNKDYSWLEMENRLLNLYKLIFEGTV